MFMITISIPMIQTAHSEPLETRQLQSLVLYNLFKQFETRTYFYNRENRYVSMNELMLRLNIEKPYCILKDEPVYTIGVDSLFTISATDEIKFLSKNLNKSLIRVKNKRTRQLLKNPFNDLYMSAPEYYDIRNMRVDTGIKFTGITVYSTLLLIRNTNYTTHKRVWRTRISKGYDTHSNEYCHTTPTILSILQYTWYNLVISELRKGNLALY